MAGVRIHAHLNRQHVALREQGIARFGNAHAVLTGGVDTALPAPDENVHAERLRIAPKQLANAAIPQNAHDVATQGAGKLRRRVPLVPAPLPEAVDVAG